MVKKYFFITALVTLLIAGYFLWQFDPERRFTLFFINKAIADTTVILLGLSFLLGPLAKLISPLGKHIFLRRYFGLAGFGGVLLHIVTSLLQFTDRFNLQWYISHLIGIIAAIIATLIFSVLALTSTSKWIAKLGGAKWKTVQRTGYIATILFLIHIWYASSPRWKMFFAGEVGMPNSFLVFIFGILILVSRILALLADKLSSHTPPQIATQNSPISAPSVPAAAAPTPTSEPPQS